MNAASGLKKIVMVSISMLLRPLLLVFFDGKYLRGRHFDGRLTGYAWGVRSIWTKNVLRLGKPMPWPTCLSCKVSDAGNIDFHPDDLNNFQSQGVYIQNFSAKVILGRGTYVAPNVGIITANHDQLNLDSHVAGKDVVIGDRCWIGMNSVILPGVVLGAGTIVAAGSVVTKSFLEGRQIIGGVPAKLIKRLNG